MHSEKIPQEILDRYIGGTARIDYADDQSVTGSILAARREDEVILTLQKTQQSIGDAIDRCVLDVHGWYVDDDGNLQLVFGDSAAQLALPGNGEATK